MRNLKYLIIVNFLFLFSYSTFSQNDTLNNDLNTFLSKNKYNENLISKINLLEYKVNAYEIDRGYFKSIIGSQTKIFSLIITVIIALLGSFTFFKFKEEIKKHQNELNKKIFQIKKEHQDELKIVKSEFKDYKEKLSWINKQSILSAGQMAIVLAKQYKSETLKFYYYLMAVSNYVSASEDEKGIEEMKTVIKLFRNIVNNKNQNEKEKLINKKEEFQEMLIFLESKNHPSLKSSLAEIRYTLNNFIPGYLN